MSPESIQQIVSKNESLQGEVEALQDSNESLKNKVDNLNDELSFLRRKIFGNSSERFIPDENQLALCEEWLNDEAKEPVDTKTITYDRKKFNKKRVGRENIPEHIPRVVTVLEPEQDTTGLERLGVKETEQLEYKPAEFYVTKFIRPVYIDKASGSRNIICANLPPLCIDKGKAGPTLVAHTLVAKCEDHSPLFRIQKQIKRDCGMELPESSLQDWFNKGAFWVGALVKRMEDILMATDYVQIDESFLKVMIKPTLGKSTQGYMWVRHSPEYNITVFNFDKKRNASVSKKLIGEDYEGTIQSDGLSVYDFLDKQISTQHAGCNGHGRRYFEQSLKNDKKRSEKALEVYRKIFAIEAEAKEKDLSFDERLLLRKEKTAPMMKEYKKWLDEEVLIVRPKDKIGKAILYTLNRWKAHTLFLENGKIEVSNNLIENVIRPLALGRRNWLFAGSPRGAERLAAVYSIILTCKGHGVNSFKYLSYVLKELPLRKNNDIDDLLPWNWAPPDNSS